MKPSPTLPPVTATGKLLTEAIIATLRAQLAAIKQQQAASNSGR